MYALVEKNADQKGPLPKSPCIRKSLYQKGLVQKGPLQIPVYDTCSTYSCFHTVIEVDH